MRREELYIETSVWNFLLAGDEPARKASTIAFFKQNTHGALFVSELVIDEIIRSPELKRVSLTEEIRRVNPVVLMETAEVVELANEYVRRAIFPVRFTADALHVAYASYYNVTAIISWNLRHIVKVKTRLEDRAANIVLGYSTPEIATPEEYTDGI